MIMDLTITGPGFSSVKFSSERPVSVSRTNSGRVISRAIVGQRWKMSISYNPMTRAQFEPIYSFLQARGRLTPFFVVLPQYRDTRYSSFNDTMYHYLARSLEVLGSITCAEISIGNTKSWKQRLHIGFVFFCCCWSFLGCHPVGFRLLTVSHVAFRI